MKQVILSRLMFHLSEAVYESNLKTYRDSVPVQHESLSDARLFLPNPDKSWKQGGARINAIRNVYVKTYEKFDRAIAPKRTNSVSTGNG